MNFIQYNPNPRGNRVGDCVIRAISGATGRDWETTYAGVSACGFEPVLRLRYLISLHRSIPWALRRSPIVLGGQSAVYPRFSGSDCSGTVGIGAAERLSPVSPTS